MAVDLLETPQHALWVFLDGDENLLMFSSQPTSATATLKSKMEQAVFFGDRSDVCVRRPRV